MNDRKKGYLGGAIGSCAICCFLILVELTTASIPFCIITMVLYVLFFITPDYYYNPPISPPPKK